MLCIKCFAYNGNNIITVIELELYHEFPTQHFRGEYVDAKAWYNGAQVCHVTTSGFLIGVIL